MGKKVLFPNLRAEMTRKGETIGDIGKLVGLSYSTIKRRFSSKSDWTISEIETICDYFGKDYYELFK